MFYLFPTLFYCKGLAVGTLLLSWVGFVGTNLNFTQRAVVLACCVVFALLYSTFDTLVNLSVHNNYLLNEEMIVVHPVVWTAFSLLIRATF